MKTFFVCSETRIGEHGGEEYDDFIEVENAPTTDTIEDWANRIRDRVRKLWHEEMKEDEDKRIVVTLDGPSPYNAMLVDLQILLEEEEGIVIELPYLDPEDILRNTTGDLEAAKVLERLEGGNDA
jgi:hypothetical protein